MQGTVRGQRGVGYALLGIAAAALVVVVAAVTASGDGIGRSRDDGAEEARDYCQAAAQSTFVARDLTLSTEERSTRLAELSRILEEQAPPDLRAAQDRLARLIASVGAGGPTVEQAEELQRASNDVRGLTRSHCGLQDAEDSFLDVEP